MVCPRCTEAVHQVFKDLEIEVTDVQLGSVSTQSEISANLKEVQKVHLV